MDKTNAPLKARTLATLCALAALVMLTGCLEQLQTTRIASGALNNFLLHLQAGELDDARAYFAPGMVTPSAGLDDAIRTASDRLRRYEIKDRKSREEALDNGQVRETVSGQVRPRALQGTPTPAPNQGWQQTDIISARLVQRGPGWRILDFTLECCAK